MDVATLKAKIVSKNLLNYLIFTGDEWKVQEIYINQISTVTGYDLRRVERILDVYSQLQNKSFFQKPIIYIVRDDKDLMQNEKLQEQIENVLGANILIHLVTQLDKRTKFYKRYNDAIVNFERLSDTMLKKYILKEIKLSERNLQRLIDICEHDYGRILLEIDKIKRYVNYLGPASMFDGVFEKLVKDGTIHEPPYDAIFDLVDAILDRNVNRAFNLLQQSYAVGEATMVMLSVLYNNAKAVLQVQTYDGNDITKGTGLTGWQIRNAKSHIGRYTRTELIYILRLVQKLVNGIKSGRMEDEFAMQYLLVHIV